MKSEPEFHARMSFCFGPLGEEIEFFMARIRKKKSNSINDYRKMVDEPWGKMFYEMIFKQLNIQNDKRIRILDFGAGFCITANHYAKNHEVIAVEPNEEMYSLRVEENEYTLITQGLDYLKTVPDNSVDVVICHNVLEYVENKKEILKK